MDLDVHNLKPLSSTTSCEVGANYPGILFERSNGSGTIFGLLIEERNDQAERVGYFALTENQPLWSRHAVWHSSYQMRQGAQDLVRRLPRTRRTVRLG